MASNNLKMKKKDAKKLLKGTVLNKKINELLKNQEIINPPLEAQHENVWFVADISSNFINFNYKNG